LTVDTGFADGEGTIKAYVSNNLSLGDQQIAAQFQEIPLDLRMVEAERIGCTY
jgi:translation initiation factor 3 subunit F